MKILQVIHQFPQTGGAGSENYTRQICRRLSKTNDVALLTMGEQHFDGPFGKICPGDNTDFPVFTFFQHPQNSVHPEQEYWKPAFDSAFENFVKEWKPDIIHFQHALQLSISLVSRSTKLKIPTFYTAHDYWPICPNIVKLNWKNQPCSETTPKYCHWCMSAKYKALKIFTANSKMYYNRLERMLASLNNCEKILCPSRFLQNHLEEFGFSKNKLEYWPFGINQTSFSGTPEHNNAKNDFSDLTLRPIQFGYTGTLAPQKGVNLLLKAFASLHPDIRTKARLSIYGNPHTDPATEKRVTQWKKQYKSIVEIQFIGAYSPFDLENIHRKLDVVVVPSVWYENRPLTILEAHIHKNPVIGSNIGGIPELLVCNASTSGWTFPPGDTIALTETLTSIIVDPSQITLRRRGIKVIPTIESEVEHLATLYRSALT